MTPPTVKSNCPNCSVSLEIPLEFETVVCRSCGAAYHIRQFNDSIGLGPVLAQGRRDSAGDQIGGESNGNGGGSFSGPYLAELDEHIQALSLQVDLLKSKEQAAPLQAGCAVFGLFGFVVLVLAAFATVGRSYFSGWVFYLVLAAVLLLTVNRMRSKLVSGAELRTIHNKRVEAEDVLAQAQAERDRLSGTS
jgi:hypothetical protein